MTYRRYGLTKQKKNVVSFCIIVRYSILTSTFPFFQKNGLLKGRDSFKKMGYFEVTDLPVDTITVTVRQRKSDFDEEV